jgi:DNA excision repair protein ERCC-3
VLFHVTPPPTLVPILIVLVLRCYIQYGKAKLVLKHNKFYVESEFPQVLQELLRDPTIAQARVHEEQVDLDEHGFISQTKAAEMKENLQILREPDDDSDDDEAEETATTTKVTTVVSFQIKSEEVAKVKRQSAELDYPLMEEYDFKNDLTNANVPQMDLKPHTRIRRYQERSLAKMFGNGRARSVRLIRHV